MVARENHNLRVAGSNPVSATNPDPKPYKPRGDRAAYRDYAKWHYRQNKAAYKARAKAHDLEMKARIRAWLLKYLSDHPCVDCGESDPIVLEFDHRDRSTKAFDISRAMDGRVSMQTLMSEVDKCDVRCANCHRRKTYIESGFKTKG